MIVVNVFAGVTDLDEFVGLLIRASAALETGATLLIRVEGRNAAGARAALASHGLETALSLEELVAKSAAHIAAPRACANLGAEGMLLAECVLPRCAALRRALD